MERGNCPKKCSDWRRRILHCLVCHHNDGQQTTRHPTSLHADPLPPDIANPSSDVTPQNIPELRTSVADIDASDNQNSPGFMNAETTAEDIEKLLDEEITAEDVEKLLDEATKLCNSILTAEDSSIDSGLLPLWAKCKEWANSPMQVAITDEISAESKSLFLPLLKKALGGAGSLHWIAFGFSFIAVVLDMIETIAENKEDVIRLLQRIVHLLKSTKNIWQSSSTDNLEELQGHVEKALRCAVICCSITEHHYLYRFLGSTSIAGSIAKLKEDVDSAHAELGTFMLGRVYEERPMIERQPTLTHSDKTGASLTLKLVEVHVLVSMLFMG